MRLKDVLSDEEVLQVLELKTAAEICEHVIKPNIERINRDLKQVNDPMYLAYMCELAVSRCGS